MKRFSLILVCLLVLGLSGLTWALHPDNKVKNRKQNTDQIVLVHADSMFFNQRVNPTAQFFLGHVEFEHNGAHMFCDSALYYKDSKSFDAFGRVRMVQGDTLSLTCDILYYKGFEQLAQARQNVELKHRGTILKSESIDYDRVANVGQYFQGGTLIDKDNELTSDTGYYYPNTRQSEFYRNVVLVNPRPPKEHEYILQSHKLFYNTQSTIAHVQGPSTIDRSNTHIYTEDGYYCSNTNQAWLLGSTSLLQHVYKELVGDSLHYDGDTHDSKAFGHVEYVDKENKNMFQGNYALYNDSTGYAEAADSAVCIDYSQADTMYAHADTFKLFTYNIDTDSVYRMVHAYKHVRAYRVDMQGVCDSLVYDGRDSCATMYKDPIVWQQNQQILGEMIKAWTNDSTIDSVHVINQALMVEMVDTMNHFNQVSGDQMHSYFRDGELYMNEADLNVYLNYYPFDSDSLMIGMVHAESTKLCMYMEDRKLQKIWMPATTGQMFPLNQTPPNMLFLENFMSKEGELAWFDYIRPLNKDDIFVWRGKKAGTELKESVKRELPTQKLSDVKMPQKGKKKK